MMLFEKTNRNSAEQSMSANRLSAEPSRNVEARQRPAWLDRDLMVLGELMAVLAWNA